MREIKERLLDASGLPGDAVGKAMRLSVEGNRMVSISGVRGVREYSLGRIRVQVEGGQVHIYGTRMELSAIGDSVAVIAGIIERIELVMEEGDGV